MEERPKSLWKWKIDGYYQMHATVSTIDSTTESENADERIVYMEDLEKRKKVYGICGECNEPGTGQNWCQPCNAKRFKDNFENWTSGNKVIDEFIQQSQLNAVYYSKCLEWIPFEKFQKVTYIAEGGFGKIYSAEMPEGIIEYWDIENQRWDRSIFDKYALKSLNNSSDICSDFLNEVKSHLQIYLNYGVRCYGITQDPNTKEYMMVLFYCKNGNLRSYINESETYISYRSKIDELRKIARGLLDIHNSGFVHKDFHSDKWNDEIKNIEGSDDDFSYYCDNNEDNKDNDDNEDNVDSEVNEDNENSKDSEDNGDNEGSENSEDVKNSQNSEIYSQVKECDEIRRKKFENKSNKDKSINIQTHPQAIYTSRLLNFKDLPKPVNSSDLSSFQINSDTNYTTQSTLANPISVQLSELELNEFW
ncbi:kinase-like domain-containing protein [Rhizophagus clarus]|uniref:Kinase-like domain-containing protein n=1 Tax=Rhizophagus clarus TaxID=94130 RepID=A0A8H3LMQ1_9GLOM|nr:kinase-like domain-containing protein [Rhizophagus clarus]